MTVSFSGYKIFNILYSSDAHAQSRNMRRFYPVSVDFLKKDKKVNFLRKPHLAVINFLKKAKETNFILLSGDMNADVAPKPNQLILKILKMCGVDAVDEGNHDLEGGNFWVKFVKKTRPHFKFLSANLTFTKPTPMEKLIAKSTIIKRNGEKLGIIGISPFDYEKLAFISNHNDFIKVMNFEETEKAVRKEVELLEKKGINKICLLAHTGKASDTGEEYYEKLSKIGGIKIIIGGHDHKKFDRWHTSERGEPVKVVSVGAEEGENVKEFNLDSFGTFKAVFDDKNNLVPEMCQNRVEKLENYPESKKILRMEERYLQTKKIISKTDKDLLSKAPLAEENPTASLAADAMLWVVNKETKGEKAQIAFVNSGCVRTQIPKGEITVGQVAQAFPFVSYTLIKTDLTKKQIFDTLNWCAESTTLPKVSPGFMQLGGMKYTVDSNNKVKDVYLVNHDGSLGEKLDEQPNYKKYSVIHDQFLLTGVAGLKDLKKDHNDPTIEYFPYTRQDAVIKYLKENFHKKPVEVKTGRIIVEPRNSVS